MKNNTTLFPRTINSPEITFFETFREELVVILAKIEENPSFKNKLQLLLLLSDSEQVPDFEPIAGSIASAKAICFMDAEARIKTSSYNKVIYDALVTTVDKQIVVEKIRFLNSYRNMICNDVRNSIASTILSLAKVNSTEYQKYQEASHQEQEEILHSISYNSNSPQAFLLQFCFEVFKNVDSILRVIYSNHYHDIYEG